MVRLLWTIATFFALMGSAALSSPDPGLMRLDVRIVSSAAAPYEQEMVLIEVIGTYRQVITLQKLEYPEFRDMSWTQLGRDDWEDITEDGLTARRFIRRIAVYPQKHGTVTIPPFMHKLKIITRDGQRSEMSVSSGSLTFEVKRKPQIGGWWLPAQSLTIKDSSDKPLDKLAFGDVAVRTVRLEAKGVVPEQLPVQPVLSGAGVFAFPNPEERTVELGPEGPVSRVTWTWTVRLLAPDPKPLAAVSIPWFDTLSREMKQAEIPEARVTLSNVLTANPRPAPQQASWLPLQWLAGLAGFALGLIILMWGRRFRSWTEVSAGLRRWRPDPELRAARRGDLHALRRAAIRLSQDPTQELAAEMQRLDRALFGPAGARDAYDSARLIRLLRRKQ